MMKKQEKLSYSIIKKDKDPYETLILVEGVSREFTLRQIMNEKQECEKYVKEIKANVKIKEASMKNIERTHPFVKDMDKEDLCACYLYYEALAFVKEAKTQADVLKKQAKGCKQTIKDIKKQTGIKI